MRIEIDTKSDSRDDLIAALKLLQSLVGDQSVRNFEEDSPYGASARLPSREEYREPSAHDLLARREEQYNYEQEREHEGYGRPSNPPAARPVATPPAGIFGMFDTPAPKSDPEPTIHPLPEHDNGSWDDSPLEEEEDYENPQLEPY